MKSQMGNMVLDHVVMNAEHELVLEITPDHIKKAKPKCPRYCVIALALNDVPVVNEAAENIQVGATCTKIQMGNVFLRYTTPAKLGRAVREFDETGKWNLGPGKIVLKPYVGAEYRWDAKKKREKGETKGVQSKFNNGKVARRTPTRKVQSISSMKRMAKAA